MCTLRFVHRRRPVAEPAPASGISGQVRSVLLPSAHLVVELHRQPDVEFLHVQSLVDPGQNFLLPVAHRPVLAGLSGFTAFSRLHALYWALAYGVGEPPEGVRFESGTLRYRRQVLTAPHQVAGDCWVAVGDGVFTTATALVGDVATHCVGLADRW